LTLEKIGYDISPYYPYNTTGYWQPNTGRPGHCLFYSALLFRVGHLIEGQHKGQLTDVMQTLLNSDKENLCGKEDIVKRNRSWDLRLPVDSYQSNG